MSFEFETEQEEWTTQDSEPVRTLVQVKLYAVSPVTFPAYPQTSVYLRSIFGKEIREVEGALIRLESGIMMDADRSLLEELIESVQGRLTAAPPEGGDQADPGDAGQLRAHLDRIRMELAKRK